MNEANPIMARWEWPMTQSEKWTNRFTGMIAWADPWRLTIK